MAEKNIKKTDQEEEIPQEENIESEEQTEEIPEEEQTEEENIPQEEEQFPEGQSQPQDPNMQMQDPNMMGMGMQPEGPPVTLPDVIRKFEFKKIYAKLHAIENFLFNNNVFTKDMIKLQKDVTNAIDLFDYIIENLTVYRKKADKIIDTFNKFINTVTSLLTKYSTKIEE